MCIPKCFNRCQIDGNNAIFKMVWTLICFPMCFYKW
jgi:hypothetical protein